ncbi:nucleoside deaminase [Streptomyces sp. ADMS]|uniref:nucleoside deaminase n=1 Tax=Streptomyces sp. ADMS TaxID=3071415 RepID=UPI00296EBA01|nr:nucleoside deaminase [Streptomyces sp. ADMS]MDW4904032.1 nucleoside deaminase [Streptomyces sp. ADMS]
MVKSGELPHPRRCVELAAGALTAGDEPFGSVLVSGEGAVPAEDHNRVASGDRTRHPEFEPARWSAARLTPEQRAAATVRTSGEHCPCAPAHARMGLGRNVHVASSGQLASWIDELGAPAPPARTLPNEVAPGVTVEGPVPERGAQAPELHRRFPTGAPNKADR